MSFERNTENPLRAALGGDTLCVAYVCADRGVPVYGWKGSSVHAQEMIRAFCAHGARVEIFAARLGGTPPEGLEEVLVHRLSSEANDDPGAYEQAAIAANVALSAALEAAGTFDVIYERYSLWSFAGMEHARRHSLPGVLEVNAPLIEEQARHRVLVDRAGAERVAERVFGAASVLCAVSRKMAAYLERYAGARGRVHVLPNAVDPARFTFAATESSSEAETFIVGFVGTLKPWHGLSTLIEAFAQLHRHAPAARLLVVGDGPERPALAAQVAASGLEASVEFVGAVAPISVPHYLRRMNVAVAPYPDYSNFYFSPLKLFEYMAAGLPIVASRIGQVAEVIADERTGLLYPPGDAQALASALERLLRNRNLGRQLGAAARGSVLRDHTWAAVADRVLKLAGVAPL